MKASIVILSTLLACANAAYYLIDVVPHSDGSVFVSSTLRYNEMDGIPNQEECSRKGFDSLPPGQSGLKLSSCPGLKVNMGLEFPDSFNGTITKIYDYDRKKFYPCKEINNDITVSFACGTIKL